MKKEDFTSVEWATFLLTNGFMPYIEDAIEETGLP